MPPFNKTQFQNYTFETARDQADITHVLVSRHGEEKDQPVASMMIDASQRRRNLEQQERINAGDDKHYTVVENGGQMRWAGGTMEDSVDRVSWLGMNKRGLPQRDQAKVLRAMMGVAVDAHGSVPHADYELSEAGSRISRAMNRRYGLKPHPKNPTMKPTLRWSNGESEYASLAALNRSEAMIANPYSEDYREYSPDEVTHLSERLQGVSAERRPKKIKSSEPKLPGMEDY